MKSDQAKPILEHYRPGEESSEKVAEALRCLQVDPALADWFARKNAFDARMSDALAEIVAPAELKSAILAERRVLPLPQWWKRPVPFAAAAAVLLFVGVFGLWLLRPAETFADYRQSVIDGSWGRAPHLDIETSDLAELNRWLRSADPHSAVMLPSGFNDFTLRGARTMEWHKHPVVLLCFSQGAKHMHLFVANDSSFSDLPPQASPNYENCGGWKTVSWSQGNRSYILTGMNYVTFLKKFRHSRQWTLDGQS